MARPRQGEVRDQRVNVRLTVDEFVRLHERASRAGQSVSDCLRAAALAAPGLCGRCASGNALAMNPATFHQIRLLGASLSEIARRLDGQNHSTPPELAPLLADVREALKAALMRHDP